MFHKVLEWAKSHPILIAFMFGGVVLVLLLSGSKSSGGDSVSYSGGPSDAAVQSGTQLSIAQMGFAAQANQTAAQVQAVGIGASRDVSIATLGADVAHYQTEQAANVQALGIAASRDVALQGYSSQEAIALGQAAAAVEGQRIAADITKTGYAAQTQQLQIFTTAQTEQNKTNASTYVELGKIQQKEQEVNQYYAYKNNKGGGGLFGQIAGGLLGAFL